MVSIAWTIPVMSLVMGLARNLTFTPVYAAYCLEVPWYTFYKAIARGCLCVGSVLAVSAAYRTVVHVPTGWTGLIVGTAVCGMLALGVNMFIAFDRKDRAEFVALVRGKVGGADGPPQPTG